MSGAVEGVDYAEAARVMFEACSDRFMRAEQCYAAIDALAAAGFITTPPARSYADGVEDAAKVADDYEQHTGDPAFDAATDVAAVTIGERIRLLSQGEKA